MKWITRKYAKVDRIACPWLIKNIIDKDAEFLFVSPEEVLAITDKEKAISYDAPGAQFTHTDDDKCTFEVLIDHYKIEDKAMHHLAKVVHGADIPKDISLTPESAGLRTIADGFRIICKDDYENMAKQFAVYDALYAYFQVMDK
jgi:hypothetical protein